MSQEFYFELEKEVLRVRVLQSRKENGLIHARSTAYYQRNGAVLRETANFLAPLRTTA